MSWKKEDIKSKKGKRTCIDFHACSIHTFWKEGKNTCNFVRPIRNYITTIMSEQSCLLAYLASANVEKEIDMLDDNYRWKLTCWVTITERFFIVKYNPCTNITPRLGWMAKIIHTNSIVCVNAHHIISYAFDLIDCSYTLFSIRKHIGRAIYSYPSKIGPMWTMLPPLYIGNISGGNQPLRANYENFNLTHMMLIQGRTYGRWEGWCAKLTRGGRDDLQMHFCKSPLPPPMNLPLDQHRLAQIEVSIVCTKWSVFTWYVPLYITGPFYIFNQRSFAKKETDWKKIK
jgi:hypothetical protein